MILEFNLDFVSSFISVREAAGQNHYWKHPASPVQGSEVWVRGRLFDQSLDSLAEKLASSKPSEIKSIEFDGVFCAVVAHPASRHVALVTSFPATSRIYWTRKNNTLYVSDHLLSLAIHGGDLSVDDSAAYQLLVTGQIMDPKTLFSAISVCNSGRIELHDKNGVSVEELGAWPDVEKYHDEQEAVIGLDGCLRRVFEKRSRIDSVPTIMLSGGLDSLAMMHYAYELYGHNIQTLTFGVKGHSNSDNSAAEIASSFWNTQHHNIWIKPEAIHQVFEDSLFAADAPTYQSPVYCAICDSGVMDSLNTDCLYFGHDTRLHTPVLDMPAYYAYLKTRNSKIPLWFEAWVRFVRVWSTTSLRGHRAATFFSERSRASNSLQEYFACLFFHFDKEPSNECFRKEMVANINVSEQDDLDSAYLKATLSWFPHQLSDNINECAFPCETSSRQVDFPFYDLDFIKESAKTPVQMGRRGQFTLHSRDVIPFSRKRLLSILLKGRVPRELVFRRKFAGVSFPSLITDDFFNQGKRLITAHKHSILSSMGNQARQIMDIELRGVLESRTSKEMPNARNFFVLLWLASCHDLASR